MHPDFPAPGSNNNRTCRVLTCTRRNDIMPLTEEIQDETPVVEDTLLDHLAEMWARENKKAFPTFIAYLNYQVYGLEHARDRRSRPPGAQETAKEKSS